MTFIGMPALLIYYLFKLKIQNFNVDFLGIYLLAPLAILIAFSSLFYSRAKVLEGEQLTKSLYTADLALRGGIYYSFALLWGFIITSSYLIVNSEGTNFPIYLLKFLYIPSLLGIFFAYVELCFGLTLIWPDLQKNLKLRSLK